MIDVLRRWYNVVIAGQYDGHTGGDEFGGVCDETFEPGQFVIELRTGLRIAVWEIDR